MKEFIEYLIQIINDSGRFGPVALFNEQPEKTRNGQGRGTRRRPVYIEPVVNEIFPQSLGINKYDMTVRVYVANDNKKFSKREDITILEEMNDLLQNLSKIEEGVFQFTTMIREFFELDSDHDQLSEPFNEYRTTLIDFTGYRYRKLKTGSFTGLSIDVQIVNEL